MLAVRLFQGEDVMSSLKEAFISAKKNTGVLMSGAGMMKEVKLGYFMGKGRYKEHCLPEPREIVSATGNFVFSEGEIFLHMHVSLADDDFKVLGGHLEKAEVHGTGEFFIYLSELEASRQMEEETGLKGLKL